MTGMCKKTMDFISLKSTTVNSVSLKNIERHTEANACIVLQYNRIALLCHDPLQLAVEPWKFEEQMAYLAYNFNVISISEMKRHLETAKPFRERTAAVTFDGGYTDILYTAKEVLERYELPATAFVNSAGIIEEKQFWWDELENLLIANHSYGQLQIEMQDSVCCWSLNTEYDRFQAYEDLFEILSNKTPAEQKMIMEQIRTKTNMRAGEFDGHRTMNAQELKELEKGGLITIGGHTHNCVKLSSLAKWQQVEEISKNKSVLEEVLGHRVEYFSYPFGSECVCMGDTEDILEDCGYSLAFGNSHGTIKSVGEINHYDIPRVKIGNCNQFVFHKYLDNFSSK